MREWSVGFRAIEHDLENLADGERHRVIKDLDWVEVSPVMRGASPETATVGVKTDTDSDNKSDAGSEDTSEVDKIKTLIEVEKLKMDMET